MNLYLISPNGDEINLTEYTPLSGRVVDGYPRGMFDIAPVEYTEFAGADGHPRMYNYRFRPLIIDVRLIIMSKDYALWQHISTVLSAARARAQPCKLKAVEGTKTVLLDVYPESSSVIINAVTGEVTLRFISYGRWYKDTVSSVSLNTKTTETVNFIALRKPGIGWDTLSSGTNGTVYSIAFIDDNSFYAGGAFSTAGGITAKGVAKWTGSTWQALGSGISGISETVYALAVGPDGALYVGGNFSTAGGITTNSIAKWTGSTWQALGTGVSGLSQTVYALAFGIDGALYVGGNFTTAGGVTVNSVAKWTGSTWQALASGLSGTVNVLYVARDGTLYAGGNFSTSTGNCIAKWTGSEWQAVGGGVTSAVYAITEGSDGALYIGGAFPTIGSLSVNYIAKWDGVTWQTLGTGANNYVRTLVASKNTLYAGGNFTSIGGVTVERAALWNGFRWLPLDIQISSVNVTLIAYNKGKLYFTINASNSAACSVVNTVTVSDDVYPRLVLTCSASGTVRYIENETTGQRVWLNYDMVAGETLTLDFEKATATSSTRGNVLWAVAAGSDMRLQLAAGTNVLWLFAPTGTISATLEWRERYQNLAEALSD